MLETVTGEASQVSFNLSLTDWRVRSSKSELARSDIPSLTYVDRVYSF